MTKLPPNSTIGIVGGGQLGRMVGPGRGPAGLSLPHIEPGAGLPGPPWSRPPYAGDYEDEAALRDFAPTPMW